MTEKPDIVQVLEHYGVEVQRGKRETQILCPVHDESRPSCSVNEDAGLIHCQACGFGGDAFTLIMRKEDCDYRSSVQIAEGITGASYSDVSGPAGRPRVGLSGKPGAGFKPRYRNAPTRRRPLSAPGS